MVFLYCSHHQNKHFSEQEVLVMTETKILKGSSQYFLMKIMLLMQHLLVGSVKAHIKEGG